MAAVVAIIRNLTMHVFTSESGVFGSKMFEDLCCRVS
jgi:hypothetical protein